MISMDESALLAFCRSLERQTEAAVGEFARVGRVMIRRVLHTAASTRGLDRLPVRLHSSASRYFLAWWSSCRSFVSSKLWSLVVAIISGLNGRLPALRKWRGCLWYYIRPCASRDNFVALRDRPPRCRSSTWYDGWRLSRRSDQSLSVTRSCAQSFSAADRSRPPATTTVGMPSTTICLVAIEMLINPFPDEAWVRIAVLWPATLTGHAMRRRRHSGLER